jgi:hypothetical protein
MPDFTGDGELELARASGLAVSGVKLTRLTLLTRARPSGVVGAEGKHVLRSGLLALLLRTGIEDGGAGGFLELLGYLRIDLTRSKVPGLRRKFLEADLGLLLRFGLVKDFVMFRGVLARAGFDGDRDQAGICVAGLAFTDRARDA